ncbi:PaaI family thioesterase [Streptomyces xiaopingdaonensis]|uniref:PaaI family thioesterase n=1 Tax=Streptomyces xiaopingdaonensis TaxID=1565415 RepID=UPI00030E5E20|nr:PaaI family thioesterase [Streptomyces xiaopingdaonensis]
MPEQAPADLLARPFAVRLGVELHTATPEETTATPEWAPDLCTVGGVLHGGALMSLGDAAGAVCAFLNTPPGAGTSTVESKTNFLRAVRAGSVRTVSRPLHTGSTPVVVETGPSDDEGRLVGRMTQRQLVPPARPPG